MVYDKHRKEKKKLHFKAFVLIQQYTYFEMIRVIIFFIVNDCSTWRLEYSEYQINHGIYTLQSSDVMFFYFYFTHEILDIELRINLK